MSGHSHFRTIKAQKEIADTRRGKIFSKIGRLITIAAKEGGGDPSSNVKLRGVIEQAKNVNMPKENIERAIKKGTGELIGEQLEEFSFEGFGPGGVAIIIEGITDNKNRTLGEIRTAVNRYGGKLAGEGSVTWMFKRVGVVVVDLESKNQEEVELLAIDSGVDDLRWRDGFADMYTDPDRLEEVKKLLEEKRVTVKQSLLGWLAKEEVVVDKRDQESLQKLFNELDENDAVQNVYSTMKSNY